jgi:uncharacterized protein (DUF924 family)
MRLSPFPGLALAASAIFPAPAAAAVPATHAATPATTPDIAKVNAFWADAGPKLWFAKDPAFDTRFRTAFLPLHEQAATGALDHWAQTPDGALALLILLDQFPRNAFRGTPRMYATDPQARRIAGEAIAAGHLPKTPRPMQTFLILPFAHSERLPDQEQAVRLARQLGEPDHGNAERHRGIIYRFGRFPHRNAILGRTTTPEEAAYLADGGYQG